MYLEMSGLPPKDVCMQFCAPRPQLSEGGLPAQLQHFQTGAMEAVGAGNDDTFSSAFEVLDFHMFS